jgi:uncharacterized protein (UPF0261 family)
MDDTILLISTLDTKGEETIYLRDRMMAWGVDVKIMDLSMGDEACDLGDIPPDDVAAACGWDIEDIRQSRERSKITAAMTEGAIRIARQLLDEKKLKAIVGLGGSTGSLMATDVMRAMPFGLPKMMISSTAALPGLATRYIDTGDLILFHSVVEISGLSPLLKNVLDRAASAACGLAKVPALSPDDAACSQSRLVALSMFGPCERCAHEVRLKLERAGFSVIGYSAAGVCDRAMETMIEEGYFCGVVDLAPGGVGEHVMGGMRSAGPHRMEAAGAKGLPQVIAPSGVNLMSPRKSRYKPGYENRRKFDLDKLRTFLRLDPEELVEVARVFARKLNQSRGPVKVLIPTRGWASIDKDGSPVYAPDEDRHFVVELRQNVKPEIEIIEVESNLEDDAFVEAVTKAFLSLLPPAHA